MRPVAQRYIMLVPGDDRFHPTNFTYEVMITTGWRYGDVDVLLKVTGGEGETPIVWLRHNYKGLLRCVVGSGISNSEFCPGN